ncbi:Uncharacterized protein dnm_092530 [Desulfonema magnum]|uniref:Uncharacterized protein n=1 Tax=Desulfonema magnum TaxID=45655 RepID=A0A975BWR4_9BACT|nr:Uncharacterized protein dnm_092530 [Desulfonema magnum]
MWNPVRNFSTEFLKSHFSRRRFSENPPFSQERVILFGGKLPFLILCK